MTKAGAKTVWESSDLIVDAVANKDVVIVVTTRALFQLSTDFKQIKKQEKETAAGSRVIKLLPNAFLLADRLQGI